VAQARSRAHQDQPAHVLFLGHRSASLAQATLARILSDNKIVPNKPTPKMVGAGSLKIYLTEVYKAKIAAALNVS